MSGSTGVSARPLLHDPRSFPSIMISRRPHRRLVTMLRLCSASALRHISALTTYLRSSPRRRLLAFPPAFVYCLPTNGTEILALLAVVIRASARRTCRRRRTARRVVLRATDIGAHDAVPPATTGSSVSLLPGAITRSKQREQPRKSRDGSSAALRTLAKWCSA